MIANGYQSDVRYWHLADIGDDLIDGPLLGVERTSPGWCRMSANDPKRTSKKSVLLSPRFDYSGLMLAARSPWPISQSRWRCACRNRRASRQAPFRLGRKPRLDLGIGEAGAHLLVERLDDFGGRIARRAEAVKGA